MTEMYHPRSFSGMSCLVIDARIASSSVSNSVSPQVHVVGPTYGCSVGVGEVGRVGS